MAINLQTTEKHRDRSNVLRTSWSVLVRVALAATLVAGVSGSSASPASASPVGGCRLDLGTTQMTEADHGKTFAQDFYIDTLRCTFIATAVRELTAPERDSYFASTANTGSRAAVVETTLGAASTSGDDASLLMSGTLTIYNRHSTWDCCGLETTYTDHQQTFDYDGSTSNVTQIGTTAWWSAGTGWWKTGGPGQFFNTGNPGSSVSTEGYASFNHPIADCMHQLNSETRSYANGSWTRSSSWTGGMCGGLIHTSSTWGTR